MKPLTYAIGISLAATGGFLLPAPFLALKWLGVALIVLAIVNGMRK